MRSEPIPLADGTTLAAASGPEQAAALARVLDLPEGPVLAQGAAARFQVDVYGPAERIVDLGSGSRVHLDGITTEYGGVVGDAKLVTSSTSSSWYLPESLTSPAMRDLAQGQMDRTILRLSEAADALGGTKAIEITTNSLGSARVWEARMSALGVPGYARIHPGGGIG